MKPFFFQNISTRKSPVTVVIDFLSTNGTFQLVYKRGNTYVPIEKIEDFTRASNIKINYAYLGGEHFCNYILTKNGDRYRFVLNKAMLESENFVWDINNAAFMVNQDGNSQTNGLSPIHDMTFQVMDGVLQLTEVNTFRRLAMNAGLNYVATWDSSNPQNETLRYYNNGQIDITFDIFRNWGLGLLTENPVLLNFRWKYNAQDISYPLAFTYCAPAPGEQQIQMICKYHNSFKINNPTSSEINGVCTMENNGTLNGPSNIGTTYKKFINY